MIKSFFIWRHRRRAAWHDAIKHTYNAAAWHYHETWKDWHLAQITSLETK